MRDTKLTFAQGVGFAITIGIVVVSAWVQLNMRLTTVETKVEVHQSKFNDFKSIQSDIIEIKVTQAKILERLGKQETE